MTEYVEVILIIWGVLAALGFSLFFINPRKPGE